MAPATADGDVSLFNTALTAGFAAQGQRQLRSEMAMVSNQVLVARAVDFGDLDAVRVAVEMTHHYLNLALEHLAGGDLQQRDRASARHAAEAAVSPRRQPDDRSAHARRAVTLRKLGLDPASRCAKFPTSIRPIARRWPASWSASRDSTAASTAGLGRRCAISQRCAICTSATRFSIRSIRCASCSARCSRSTSRRRTSARKWRRAMCASASSC